MMFFYDEEEKIARADTAMFRLDEGIWHRSDVALFQAAYSEEEVMESLRSGGFSYISTCGAEEELGLPMGEGRTFFLALK
jgi:hypothetical protein